MHFTQLNGEGGRESVFFSPISTSQQRKEELIHHLGIYRLISISWTITHLSKHIIIVLAGLVAGGVGMILRTGVIACGVGKLVVDIQKGYV